jgi:hypothetical protein
MSTKTLRKRIALVAVSALGFGLMSAVPSSAAEITATIAGTNTAVRVSSTDGVQDAVPAATFSFTLPAALNGDELQDSTTGAVLTVTQAPSATADVIVNLGGTSATDELATAPGGATLAEGAVLAADVAEATAVTGTITVSGTATGTYKGNIVITDSEGDNNVITVTFSFTTTGKVATLSPSVTAVSLPSIAVSGGAFVVSKSVTLTLKDSAGNTTQPSTGDTIGYAITGTGTNIAFAHTGTASGTLSNADLADGSQAITVGSVTATADSETVTFTPAGVMPAQGVVAATMTATTTGYGVETAVKTALTSPTAASVVAAGTSGASEVAYDADLAATTLVFTVSGYTAGAAYKIRVDNTGVDGVTAKDNTSNTTAASATSDLTLYGIADATGSVLVTVVLTAPAATDTIGIGANNGDNDTADASDAKVTFVTAAYAASITNPLITPTMVTTGSAIAVSGKIADQFGNPLSGASVSVTGTVTTTDTTPANLTGTATSAADGTWSVSLSAATALTTSVSIVATATKTGTTVTDSAARVVNFTASGSPASMTWSGLGDEDSFTALAPLSQYPATVVPYTGSVTGDTDELYTISTGVTDGTLNAEDGCVALTATTTPGSQVVFTGTAGVKFTKTSCATAQSVAKLLDTVTVASGTPAYAVATKTGANTVTMTSGTVSKTATFYAYNALTSASAGDAIRNLSVDKAAMSLNAGQIGFLTITATDAFGNLVKSAKAAAGAVVTVKASGQALLDGPALSRDYTTTDSAGQIVVGVIAGATAGTSTVAITSTGAQLGAAAGSATSTTAGTNGLTASVSTASTTVTIVGNTTDAVTTAAASTDAKIAALQAALEALAAKSIADKIALDAAIAANAAKAAADTAAAQAAAVAAAEAAADAAAEAIDAGNNAFDAATSAGEAADAATAAAEQAGEDATAAANAAGEAAVAAAEAAQEAAAEATDAANAATDAANASAEAADAATAAAQDAADAVAALSTQVSEMISALKKQITSLTNLVIKIQKKVKA